MAEARLGLVDPNESELFICGLNEGVEDIVNLLGRETKGVPEKFNYMAHISLLKPKLNYSDKQMYHVNKYIFYQLKVNFQVNSVHVQII